MLVWLDSSHSQEAAPEINDKAKRYHSVLLNRPNPGSIFDRFFDAWMATGTVDSLEAFLLTNAQANGAKSADKLLLAFFHTRQGADDEALEAFDAALATDAGNAEAWFQKAKIEARLLRFDDAIATLDEAAKADPKPELGIEIAKLKGKLLVRGNQNEEALKVWSALLEANPDDGDLHEDLIELQIDEGLFDEAIATSKTLIGKTRDPYQKVLRQLRMGDIQQRSGDRAGALESYTGTLGHTGQGTWLEREVLAQIEELYRREDDLEGFSGKLLDLQESEGKRLALRQRRVEILAELGYEEEAVASWKEVLELTPGDRAVREAFVAMLGQLGRYEEAATQLQALIAQHPQDAELLVKLAEFQVEAKQKEAAGKSLLAYLEKSGAGEYEHLRTARLLGKAKLQNEADGVFQRLLAKFPDSADAKDAYAAFLFESGKEDAEKRAKAVEIWQKLANAGNAQQAVRVARKLVLRGEVETAFELLHARYEELNANSAYLNQLCQIAMQLDRADEAFAWARRNALLADEPLELADAVELAKRVARRAGNLPECIAELRAADRLSIQETCVLAELLDESGDRAEADALLAAVTGEDARLALNQQIRLFRGRGNWKLAAAAQEKLFSLPGGRRSVHAQTLVELHERAFDYEAALKWIGEWKRLSPGSPTPWLRQAELLGADGRHDEAVRTLRSAALRFEDEADVTARMAQAYVLLGKTADARRLYWRLFEDAEDSSDKIARVRQLIELARETGQTGRLIEEFEERRGRNRTSIVPLLALAEIHRFQDNFEERRKAILEAARLQPRDVSLQHQLASIDEAAGNVAGAIRTLEAALEHDSSDRTRSRLARLHFLSGDFEAGFEVIDSADANAKPEELVEVANLMFQRGAWEEAVELLAARQETYPDDYRIHYLHALALEEAERNEEAMAAFEVVLGLDRELPPQQPATPGGGPHVSAPAVSATMARLQKLWQARYPEEARLAIELMDGSNAAYSHRQGRGRGRIYGFHRHGGPVVSIPGSVNQARAFALAHLIKLGGDAQAHAKRLERHLKNLGLPQDFRQLSEIALAASRMQNRPPEGAPELVKFYLERPDDRLLHAVWLMRHSNLVPNPKIAAAALELFRETNPGLAWQAAMNHQVLWSKGDAEPKRALLKTALEVAKEIPTPLPSDYRNAQQLLIYDKMAQSGNSRYVRGTAPFLTDELRAEFRKLAAGWEEEAIALLPEVQRAEMRLSILVLMAQDEDLAPFVKRLESAVAEFRQSQANARGAAQLGGYGSYLMQNISRRLWNEPLNFPPVWLPELPIAVQQMFGVNPMFGSTDAEIQPPKERLTKFVDGIRDPLLRLCVARYCGEEEKVAAAVEEIAKSDPPTAPGLLLAASHAIEREKPGEAVSLLSKARYLNPDRATSWLIDTTLVKLSLASEDERFREAGRGALLRIHGSGNVQQYQHDEVLAAMEKLGLEQEATRQRTMIAQRQQQQQMRSTSSGAVQTNDPDVLARKITTMLDQNQDTPAIRLAANQLKQLSTTLLSGSNYSSYTFRRLRERVQEKGLGKAILDDARPEEDAKSLEKVRFAALADILGEWEVALSGYRAILQQRPDDDAIRRRVAILLTSLNRSQEALVEIRKLAKGDDSRFLRTMFYDAFSSIENFDGKFGIVEVAATLMAEIEPMREAQDDWPHDLLERAGADLSAENMRIPGILSLDRGFDPTRYGGYDKGKYERVLKRRDEAFLKFGNAMLKHPAHAADSFAYLAAARLHREGEDIRAELLELAGDVLRGMSAPALIGNNHRVGSHGTSTSGYGGPDANEYLVQGPIEFAAVHAYELGKREWLYGELLPELEKRAQPLATVLKLWADLYFCEPKDFPKAIAALKSQTVFHMHYPIHFYGVVDAWERRDDLEQFDFIAEVGRMASWVEKNNTRLNFGVIGAALQRKGGTQETMRLLDLLAEVYLGPADQRKEFVRENYDPRNTQSNTPGGRIYQFSQIVDGLGKTPRLVFPTMEMIADVELHVSDRISTLTQPFSSYSLWRDPKFGIALLENSPFVKNLDEARFFIPGKVGRFATKDKRTLPGMVVKTLLFLRLRYAKDVPPYIEWAKKQPQDALGAKVLGLTLEKKDNSEAVLAEFVRYEQKIRNLPKERLLEVASFAADVIEPNALSSSVPQGNREFLDFLMETAGADKSGFESFLAAETVDDLGISESQLDDMAAALIANEVMRNRELALKLFTKALEIEDATRKKNRWNYNFGSGRTVGGRIFEGLFDKVPALDAAGFVGAVWANPELRASELQQAYTEARKMAGDLGQRMEPVEFGDDREKRLAFMLDTMQKTTGEHSIPVIPEIALWYAIRSRAQLREFPIVDWAAKPDIRAKYPRLAKPLEIAARMDAAERQNGANSAMPPEVTAYYVEMLENAGLPLMARIAAVQDLRYVRLNQPVELRLAAARALTEIWEKSLPDYYSAVRNILHGFESMENAGDEAWKTQATRLAKAFETRYFSGNAPAHLDSTPDYDGVRLMTSVHLRNGDPISANRLLNRFESNISDFTLPFLRLVEAGEFTGAARLLRKHPEKIARSYPSTVPWSEVFAERVPKFLDSIQSPSQRIYAQVILAAMPGEAEARTQRLLAAAEQLKQVDVPNPTMRLFALQKLAREPGAREILADRLLKAAEGVNLKASFERRTTETLRNLEIYVASGHARLLRGDTDGFAGMLRDVAAIAGSSNYGYETWKKLLAAPDDFLQQRGFDSAACQPMIGLFRVLCRDIKWPEGRNYPTSERHRAFGRLVWLHYHTDSLRDLQEWLLTITNQQRKYINLRDGNTSLGMQLLPAKMMQGKPLEERIAYHNTLFQTEYLVREMNSARVNAFNHGIQAKFFTRDEILEHGPAMAAVVPRFGEAWRDLSQLHESRKNHELALECWDKWLETKWTLGGRHDYWQYHLHRSKLLNNLGHKDEALEQLSQVDVDRVAPFYRGGYNNMAKRLGLPDDSAKHREFLAPAAKRFAEKRAKSEPAPEFPPLTAQDEKLRQKAAALDVKTALAGGESAQTYVAAAQTYVKQGDWPGFRKILENVRQTAVNAETEPKRAALWRALLQAPDDVLAEGDFSAQTCTRLLPFCQNLALEKEWPPTMPKAPAIEREYALGRLMFLYFQAGVPGKLDYWLSSHGNPVSSELSGKLGSAHTTIFALRLAARAFKGQPVAVRIAWTNEFCGRRIFVERMPQFRSRVFEFAIKEGLFSRQEILEHGVAMAEAAPRRSEGWYDLSRRFEESKKWDESIAAWQNCEPAYRARSPVRLAWLQFRGKKLDEARANLEKIADPKKMSGADRKRYAELRKKLGMNQ